jgi:hypothetical protein
MTRKDYVLLAKAIRDTQERIKSQFEERRRADELNLVDPRIPLTAQLRGVRRAAAHICDALAADNPRFDPTQFLKACGYGATSMNPRDPALDLRPLPDEATRRALNAR